MSTTFAQAVISASSTILALIKTYVQSPVIGGEPINKASNSSVVNAVMGEMLKGGIRIEAEYYKDTEQADVSAQMLLTTAGNKSYVADNICPMPRTWEITGYIPSDILDVSGLYAPSLKKKQEKLRTLYNSRSLTWFKTRECKVVQVMIQSLSFEPRADVSNKLPVSIVLKKADILTVAVVDPSVSSDLVASDVQPNAGSTSGLAADKGSVSVSSASGDLLTDTFNDETLTPAQAMKASLTTEGLL